MPFLTDLSRSSEAAVARRDGGVVQRPTLGTAARSRGGARSWLLPRFDLLCAALALTIVAFAAGSQLPPALPLPLLAALLVLTLGSWRVARPLARELDRVERWVLVADEETSRRLQAHEPLRRHATIVRTVPPGEGAVGSGNRIAALGLVDRCRADRVVISSRGDEEDALELVRAFRSVGVPVSVLARPLDLLEAPAARPHEVGGVPLIDVEALAVPGAVPYSGPDRRRDRTPHVSVVVPAMNEERNIGQVLSRLPDGLHEVILVDGNSEDETVEVARRACPRVQVLSQQGRGKGDAFRTGFAAVTGNLVVMLDADGSAAPEEIPRFVEALEAGADFAKGSRFVEGGGSDDITPLRRLGNGALSWTANLLHRTSFTDLCYGYNAFWARCLPFIAVDSPGFEVETLINLRLADAGMRIAEVPSHEAKRISGQSKLKTFRDGFRVLGTILAEARRRRAIRP